MPAIWRDLAGPLTAARISHCQGLAVPGTAGVLDDANGATVREMQELPDQLFELDAEQLAAQQLLLLAGKTHRQLLFPARVPQVLVQALVV